MPGLDYSAARLSGGAVKAAGFDFVIRYVGTPGRTKNITAAEYADLTAAGVAVALVYENVAEDALSGFMGGQGAALAARKDADSIGFPADRPIYFAVDWVATAGQMDRIMAYISGVAEVLGAARVGVYGFQLTIQTAMNSGHARWFWQCGARSALVPGTHLYQHNNDNTTVSGITCDVNDALQPDFGQTPIGAAAVASSWDDPITNRYGGTYAARDILAAMDAHINDIIAVLTTPQPSRVPGSPVKLNPLDAAMTSDGYGYQIVGLVATLTGKVDGLTTALGHLAQGQPVDLAAVTKAAHDGTTAALAGLPVHVTVAVSPPAAPTP